MKIKIDKRCEWLAVAGPLGAIVLAVAPVLKIIF